MLFDTHAHYDDEAFDEDREALLASMPEHGVGLIVNPGCDVPSSRKAVQLAHQFPHVYAAVGIHPENAKDWRMEDVEELARLAADDRVRAIGEIGLDYYWKDCCPPEEQKAAFRAQMELAQQVKLPVIIHDREAHADCLTIVREYPNVTGVFHCFSGSLETAQELLALGYSISFTGVITFKNEKKSQKIIPNIPHDRLMIETDSPYLAPVPYRGKRNSSLYVGQVAERVAALWNMQRAEVERITMENGRRFFGIGG